MNRCTKALATFLVTLVIVPVVGGCSSGSDGGDSATTAADPATCATAAQPFGTDPAANEFFPDVEWTACDGAKVTVADVRCDARLTVISIGAGWCEPCRLEAPLLEAAKAKWADRGVRVVQVLFQDVTSQPATTLFCRQWQQEFDLSIDVYVDPVARSLDPFDDFDTPTSFALDRDGRVLWVEVGVPADLDGTIAELLTALP